MLCFSYSQVLLGGRVSPGLQPVTGRAGLDDVLSFKARLESPPTEPGAPPTSDP